MPADVVLGADVGAVVPDSHEDMAPVRRALDLRQPVTIAAAPGAAIVGVPLTDGRPRLPPDGVDALGPELADRETKRVAWGERTEPFVCHVEHVFYYGRAGTVLASRPERSHQSGAPVSADLQRWNAKRLNDAGTRAPRRSEIQGTPGRRAAAMSQLIRRTTDVYCLRR